MHEEQNKKIVRNKKFKFKKDQYGRKRGQPVMLKISCLRCGDYLMHYQKDGPGPLIRCYLDRIHAPSELQARQFELFDIKTSPKLCCRSCKTMIGFPIVYQKENRAAYHLVVSTFTLKKESF